MALKNCMAKAGKALDVDDRDYMRGLLDQGRPDQEVVNRLEQNIVKERDELTLLLEDQGLTVKKESSEFREESKVLPASEEDAPASAKVAVETLVSEGKSDDSVAAQKTKSSPASEAESSAKPSTKLPGEEFGSKDTGVEPGEPQRVSRTEDKAKPSPKDAGSTKPSGLGAFFRKSTAKEKAAALKNSAAAVATLINEIVPNSPLLAHFIKSGDVELTSDADQYSPETDVVYISGDGLPSSPDDGFGRTLDLSKKADMDEQVLVVEHEITHAYTVPYLQKVLQERNGTKEELANIDYLDNALIQLEKVYRNGTLGPMHKVSAKARSRIEYVLAQPSLLMGMSEFVAIMTAETDVANEIYTALTGKIPEKTLRSRIEAIIASVKASFLALTKGQIAADIDAEALQQAILNTFVMGKSMREQRADEFTSFRLRATEQLRGDIDKQLKINQAAAFEKFKRERPEEFAKTQAKLKALVETDEFKEAMKVDAVLGINSPFIKSSVNPTATSNLSNARKASFDYLNYAVASMLNSKLERKGKQLLGNLHNIMNDRFPIYADAANKAIGIYDGSPALQQFLHTVTGENVNKVKKANVLAKFAETNAQRTEIINEQVSKLTTLSRDLSDIEKADLATFTADMPLHDYFVLAGDLSTADEIEAEAELLRKELWKINARAVRDVDQLIDWNVDGNLTGTIYNLDTKYPLKGEFALKLRKYLAIESIRRIGSKKFEKLLKNEELMSVIKDNSVANAISTLDNEGTENVRDSLVMDYYKEPFQIKAVQQKDFRMYEFGEETGWKILKAPTKTELGIVYKPTIDSTDIAGAYTDMKMSSTDIDVGPHLKRFNGVVETRNGHKLLLNADQKKELGLIEGFEQGLVRSTAHSIAMQESQIIRDQVLQDDTWMAIGKGRSINKLEGIIESDNIDNPWFIQLEEGTEYSKLPASVRAKYMPVGSRASNVKGFNEKVDLVRKDISHWLLGGSAKSLFQNPQMKWAIRILKNLVSGAKIGMIVLNPIKIANDNLSNLTYLGVLGLNPKFIAQNYAEIQRDFAEYTDLQRQIFQLKLQLISRPESDALKKKLKGLQKRTKANSVGDIGEKGFVNSLGSDLVSRSADTLSGFQADMHRSLEYLLTDKSGNKNVVSHFIIQLQKIGYQAEDFFGYLGDIASKAKSAKLLEQELDQVADRLREIKSEEDIVNYVSQFTTSPSSEAVRFGSAMTDLTDVLSKETLYRHLTQNQGMSPSDARIRVLDSFPDYKENMPLAIKALSDMGIIMFPSFWLRIQKIIYRMARDKPVGLATELMIQEMLGTDVNTIFEANVINKSNTFGGLLHTPFEPVGLGSVVPTHLFSF